MLKCRKFWTDDHVSVISSIFYEKHVHFITKTKDKLLSGGETCTSQQTPRVHTVLQALILRVQQEVLEAVGDAVIRQKLQIVLIKLELERVLVVNLE